jgi:hypothetical protein
MNSSSMRQATLNCIAWLQLPVCQPSSCSLLLLPPPLLLRLSELLRQGAVVLQQDGKGAFGGPLCKGSAFKQAGRQVIKSSLPTKMQACPGR